MLDSVVDKLSFLHAACQAALTLPLHAFNKSADLPICKIPPNQKPDLQLDYLKKKAKNSNCNGIKNKSHIKRKADSDSDPPLKHLKINPDNSITSVVKKSSPMLPESFSEHLSCDFVVKNGSYTLTYSSLKSLDPYSSPDEVKDLQK
ncbi:hypothetical protein JTE90_025544 [Oedothorax gibbosus]|uniref:Uncharacterized protein n=1 Tax=Oedothorax gibbosus TaxID=931172 RepID=A0AAV6TXM0_9ARAC|nr:hypothetical protein JTE90_025544 [Oedothorax gibbosus]